MQIALAADSNGAPVVRAILIKAKSDGDGEELLAHAPGIVLQWQIGEEELMLQSELPLDEQDGACISSQTGYPQYCHNAIEIAVKKVTISTRVVGAR